MGQYVIPPRVIPRHDEYSDIEKIGRHASSDAMQYLRNSRAKISVALSTGLKIASVVCRNYENTVCYDGMRWPSYRMEVFACIITVSNLWLNVKFILQFVYILDGMLYIQLEIYKHKLLKTLHVNHFTTIQERFHREQKTMTTLMVLRGCPQYLKFSSFPKYLRVWFQSVLENNGLYIRCCHVLYPCPMRLKPVLKVS